MLLKDPLVTVVMSTYNDANYISDAVDGILRQSYRNIELRILVDGSTDETLEVLKKYTDPRVYVKYRENRGKAASMNELISDAQGEYILINDSDDVSAIDRVSRLIAEFKKYPEIVLVQSGYSLIINGKVVCPKARELNSEKCAEEIRNYRLPELDPTTMVRADVAKLYLFNEKLRIGQGIDFIYRIAEKHPMRVVGEALYYYRYNPKSITKVNRQKKIEYLTEVMNLARKRRGEEPVTYDTILAQQGTGRKAADNNLSGHFTESVYTLIESGRRWQAIVVACYSLRFLGDGLRFGKPLLYAVTPLWLGRMGRACFGQNRR
ncbi:glycosyltransferase family A protein [uncultured Thalassolituus sp.]|jgi:glycosyltransferase involved in cell wall biosynthesis|uniref:glycosyltransferase family 2 protein n=1 Tax=uncultured Thalassolituus sp. TaxID=285273 RepID=UPI00261E6B20|nr:glycosyltransferase family A protein [uncultured Thalassolituus sp.]